ncbi:GGDEF domain-containing protein [Sinimarinibacterium sp. CAU 1509]|uniref:GGDEF domain-containing protein n=1 Tax=Sinimarinibacterium sp. CAU 1509 TaxID=2562283 RepID=UPI00146D6946|nr:GGDEF domain-containing protein [Sinimarinibacterium sp. CAU 1509]
MTLMLDMPTLVLNTGLSAVYAMVAMLFVWRVHSSELAVRFWGGAFLALGAGAVLVGLRNKLPDFWTIVIGNLLIMAGYFMLHVGTALFTRRPVFWRSAIGITLASAAALAYWSLVTPNIRIRVAVFSGAMVIACALIVRDLLRASRGPQQLTYGAVATVFVISIIATLVRATDALIDPEYTQLFSGGVIQVLWFAASQAAIFLSPFGFLLLTSQRLQLRLDRLANEDELTGVLNRRAFLARTLELLADLPRGQSTALLALDLDHFKRLNDTHGHAAGDAVLRNFARTVTMQLRPDDLFARVGGEEFWILLPDTDVTGATQLAERLRAAVEAMEVSYGRDTLTITVSIGVSAVSQGDVSQALTAADGALYAAKEQGRNCVSVA